MRDDSYQPSGDISNAIKKEPSGNVPKESKDEPSGDVLTESKEESSGDIPNEIKNESISGDVPTETKGENENAGDRGVLPQYVSYRAFTYRAFPLQFNSLDLF